MLSSYAQTISRTIRLSDGRTVDASHIFLENDNGTFFTEPSGTKADWSLSLYNTKHENEVITVLISDESSDHFTINIDSIDWFIGAYHFTHSNDSSVYYKGVVSMGSKGIVKDKIKVTFNLAPSTPKILDVAFDYEYDWNDDMIFPNGNLHIKISSSNVETFTLLSTDDFCFEFPKRGFNHRHLFYPDTSDTPLSTIHCNYADWGEYYSVIASNKYGNSVSNDTILTTDYITDPDILARIEELRNESGSLCKTHQDNEIHITTQQNYLVIVGDKTTIDYIAIFDMTGRTVSTQNNGQTLSINNLQKGCYIVKCRTKQNKTYIFKFIKS